MASQHLRLVASYFHFFFFFHSLDTFNLISNKKKEKFLNKKKTKPNSKSMIMDAKILI